MTGVNPPDTTLAVLRDAAAALESSLPERLHPSSLTLKSKLPFKVLTLREAVIHRMAALSTSAVHLLDLEQPVAAAVLARAALESTALLYGLAHVLEDFLSTRDEEKLDEFLMKGLVGTRWKDAPVQSTNVLTLIDRLDSDAPGFRAMYDELCEFAHPNWPGLIGAFTSRAPDDEYEVLFGSTARSDVHNLSVNLLFIVIDAFQTYYNGMIPKLVALNSCFGE